MNYEIIKDLNQLTEFINWLPELENGECYMFNLFARNKYCKEVSADKAQLKRFTTNKEMMLTKIKQLEVEYGAYTQKGNPIPQEALALYITLNPRSYVKSAKNLLIELAHMITRDYDGYNPHQIALTQIQKSCSRRIFTDFDFDNVNYDEVLNKIVTFVNEDSFNVLKTKNGFHVIIEHDKIETKYKKSWYNNISKIDGCDIKGDSLIPVTGCVQGDFAPTFIK